MPFDSAKQRAFLFANKPDAARKIAEHKNKGGMIKGLAEKSIPPLYRAGGGWVDYLFGSPSGKTIDKTPGDNDGKIGWMDHLFGYGRKATGAEADALNKKWGIGKHKPKVDEKAVSDQYTERFLKEKYQQGIPDYKDPYEGYRFNADGTVVSPDGMTYSHDEWQKYKAANPPQYKKGGGLLKLGDEQADLAKANLDRIRKSGGPKTIEMQRREWLDANRHKRGAQMPAHLRDKPSLDDLKEPLDVATDFIPVVGEAKDFARAGADVAAGNYGSAALNTAAGVAGIVPGVGDAAAAGLRTVGRNLKSGAKPKNFHGWERASQRVPHLVKNQDDWNNVNTMAQRGENIEIGPITRRDAEKRGGSKDTRPGQEGRNAAVTLPNGTKVPVVVVPHKDPNKKWHVITVRDQGRDGKQTGVLGGRMYEEGGPVKKKRSGNVPGSARAWWNYIMKNNNLRRK